MSPAGGVVQHRCHPHLQYLESASSSRLAMRPVLQRADRSQVSVSNGVEMLICKTLLCTATHGLYVDHDVEETHRDQARCQDFTWGRGVK